MINRGFLKQNTFLVSVIQKIVDASVVFCVLALAATFYELTWNSPQFLILGFCAVALYSFFANLSGLNNSWRGQTMGAEFQAIIYTWVGMTLCLLMLGYATKTSATYSRLTVGTWLLITPFILLVVRYCVRSLLRHFRKQGYNVRCIAIVGIDEVAQYLAREISEQSWMGLRIEGFYDNRAELRSKPDPALDINVIGRFDDLVAAAKANQYDAIYIALPMRAEKIINKLVNELSDSSVPVHIVPDLFTFNLITSRSTQIGRIPILSIYESPFDEMGAIIKRCEDILLGSLILSVIAIPMLLIAIGIKLTSSGPIIFRQRRYGMGGEEIVMWKFRSMTVCEDGDDVPQAKKGDARVTPLGAFLRRTSLDELPQFFNVLQGSMSIVGPRPHAVAHNELYREKIEGYMLRHLVKPGITGWAQVNGWRGETDTDDKMEKRIECDLEYVRNWSLLLDLRIIIRTLLGGLTGKNAY